MQDEIRRLQNLRNPMYANQIKSKQSEIEQQGKIVEELITAVRKAEVEDQRVGKKVEELILKYGGDSKKALEAINSQIKLSRGKSTKFDQDVANALTKRIAEDKNNASKNDPLNLAIATLNSSAPADIPQALEGVVGALLAKAGITIDKLNYGQRQDLANILKGASGKLIAISNDTRKTSIVKQQEKQLIIKTMVKDVGYLVGTVVSGVSKQAMQTGNLKVMAIDAASNKLVNYLTGDLTGASNIDYTDNIDFNAGFSDDNSDSIAFETLGLRYGATIAEINRAYRSLALKNHPDRGGNRAKFEKIQQAYETLNPYQLTN
jgi:DnaJ-domain-containing protein 1